MTEYRSKHKVEARQVEDDEETVIGSSGSEQATKGQYVVTYEDGNVGIMNKEDFEDQFETGGKSSGSAEKKDESTEKKDEPTQNKPETQSKPRK